MSRLNRVHRGVLRTRTRRTSSRKKPGVEILEPRQVLSAASINSVAISLSTPGPTSISGSLNPGDQLAAYRIDGSAGEQLQFHSVSTSSTGGSWFLLNESNQEVAGTSLGSDFTANLTINGPYYLELVGNSTPEIDYSFQVSDLSSYPPPASGGFNTEQTGSLDSGATTTFTFTAPAGLPVYFNSLGFSQPIEATLTDPNNNTVFNYTPYYYGNPNAGPYLLPATGTYTLTLYNYGGSSGTYDFNLLSLPDAATSLALGPTQTVAGALSPGDSTAVYSFLGAAGERVFLDNQQPLGDPVDLTLIQPDGNQVFNIGSYSDSGPLSLTESGTYYLVVQGLSSSPIDYQFRLTDTAYAPLAFGTPISDTLDPSTATDVYSFTGTAGQTVTFQDQYESNGYYGASWTLYGPNNQSITGSWFGSNLSATLPVDGTYTLEVNNYSYYGPSSYTFEAYVNVNPTSPMTLGTEETGTIANPGDQATYTFTGTPGQEIYFDGREPYYSYSSLDATLTDPYGAQVFNQSMGYDAGPYILTQGGTYTLTVSGSAYYTGNYDFVLDDTSAATPVDLSSGPATVSGTLATGSTTDLYSFSGTAGEGVTFVGQGDSPAYNSDVYLYGPDGREINGQNLYYDQQWNLPSTGTYLVAVQGLGYTTGPVSYQFELSQNVDTTSSLTLGQEVTGTIVNPGDQASYTFTGSPGQQIYLDNLGFAYGLTVTLSGPTGNSIYSSGYPIGDSDLGPYTLSQAGTYTLTINGYYYDYYYYGYTGATGSYDFVLDDTSTATPIALTPGQGTTESGTLATGLTTNLYEFSGTAGQRVYFQGQQDSPSSSAIAYLYSPNDNQIASVYLENSEQWTLPSTGTYLLAVAGNGNGGGPVDYQFELFDNVQTTSGLTLGQEVVGAIANPGDQASYTFNGSVGQQIYLDNLGFTYGLVVTLSGPAGNTIYYSYSPIGDSDAGPLTLAADGTYTLTINGDYWYGYTGATGSYDFVLDDTSTARPIALTPGQGTTESGTLATALSTDLYSFSGTAGQRVYFQGQQDSPSSSAIAYLYDPNNNQIAGVYLENSEQWTLPYTGTYLLAVAGDGNGGGPVDYQFELFDNVQTTSGLTLGQEVVGAIANPGDQASYTFNGSVGQQIYLDNLGFTYGLAVTLSGPAGNTIYYSYSPIGNSDAGPFTLTQAGTYTLTINGDYYYGYYGATGSYDFVLDDTSTATPIALTPGQGTTESGTLATALTTDLYSFSGTAGQRVYFQGQQDSPSYSAIATLYDPNGNYVNSVYLENSQQWTLPYTGTYLLAVAGDGNAGGPVNYGFELFDNVNPTAALVPGQEASGTLANPGDEATYTFTGSPGQNLFFDGLSADGGIDAYLATPGGYEVFNVAAGNDRGPFTLGVAGTYTLTIYGNGNTGSYDFRLLDTSAQTLTPGASTTTVTGTLSPGTSAAIYQIMGTAGEQLTLTSDSFGSTSGTWYLVDPNNNVVQSAPFGTSFNNPVTLGLTGPYELVLAGADTTDPSVGYAFDITATSPAPVTPSGFGTEQTGSLDPGASTTFTVDAPAGLTVYFNSLGFSQPIEAKLTDPNNSTIFDYTPYYYGNPNAGPYVLSVPGTYTLTLTNNGGSSGTYDFNMLDLTDTATALPALGAPQTVVGTLTPGNSTAAYSFTATAGQTLFLDNQQPLGNPADIELIDPYNNDLFNIGSYSNGGPLTLTASGTYYLLVQGYSSSPIDYQFRLTDALSVPLTFGTPISGTLDPATATDVYSFTGTAGEAVTFQPQYESNGYYGAIWGLVGPEGQGLGSGYWFGGGFSATLPENGTYTLVIDNYSDYGPSSYTFEGYVNVNPTTPMTLGQEVTGTIANPGDQATYTFTGSVGQQIYFDSLANNLYGYAILTGPSGATVFNDYLYYDTGPYTLTQAGTYTLTIAAYSESTGTYDFVLDDTAAAPTISIGSVVNDSLATDLTTNIYQLSGTAGETVTFEMLSNSEYYGLTWSLYTADSQGVGSGYYSGTFTVTLPDTGTYFLFVSGTGYYGSGPVYSFQSFANVNPTSPLTLGTEVTGTIANPGDQATYTFTGSVGQQIYFDSLANNLYGHATLTGPSGATVFNDYLYDDTGPYTLTQAGTYTLTIGGYSYSTGTYDFVLDDTAAAPTISVGSVVNDSLATGLTTNIYQLSGTAGEQVGFTMLSIPYYYDLGWSLYSADSVLVASGSYSNAFSATLPYTGTYFLFLSGTGYSGGGFGYSFEATTVTTTTAPLTLGQATTGTLADPFDQSVYTFTATPGQTLYFNGFETSPGIYAELTDPYGDQVFNVYLGYGYYYYNDHGPFTLTYGGTYTLTIYGNGSSTGSYGFTLDDTATATPIAPASPVSGTLATGLTTDLYQFSGTAGERVFFDGLGDSPSYSAIAFLYDPNNDQVTDFYLEYNAFATLPYTGTYILAVTGDGNASGEVAYSFEFFQNANPTASIALGQEVTGNLVNPGDEATYTFTGSAGQEIWFDGREGGNSIYAVLDGPTGSQVFDQYMGYDAGPYTLALAGTYTLTVYGSGTATGPYDFVVDDVAAASTSIPLTPGQGTTESGTLATGLTTNLYQFSGTAGQQIYFQGQGDSPGYSAIAYLYDPDNRYIASVYLEGNQQWTLPYTGTYTLAVYGDGNTTGPVAYQFELFANVNTTTPMTLNSEVTGSLTNPGDTATYTFTGSIGQQIQFNGLEPGSGQVAYLYDPEGNEVFGRYLGNNAGPYTLTTPGTYTLVITTNGTYTGNYDFRLLDLQSETKLQVGTTEADLTVTLSAPAAQQVLIQYNTADGTATVADGDYKPAAGLLLFQPGQTTATVEVQAIDRFASTATYLDVNLSNPVGATIDPNAATGVITINANGGGTLNGEVFNDLNGNGTLDGGEPGLAGWTVELLDSSNDVVATTTTDANGDYTFTAIPAGSYTVEEIVNSGFVQTAPPTPGTYAVTLSGNQTINDLNFGDFQTVTLAGQVFNDVNGNGVQDPGDTGLAGWTVELLDASNTVIATATTDANGDYAFAGVGPGIYTIEEVLQSGYVQTTNSPAVYTVHTSSGQDVGGLTFGDFALATVGGEVFDDLNGNGVLDTGEPGIANWTVELLAGTNVIATTTTDANGDYAFNDIGPGTYTIEEVQQSGYTPTTPTSLSVTTTSGLVSTGNDFGQYQIPTISGEVYDDLNGNGVLDTGEPGLANWTVELLNASDSIVATTTTDAGGDYVFPVGTPGTYTVEVVTPGGYITTEPATGSYTVTVTSGQSFANQDFGEFQTVTLGGEVFNDLNGNGVLDGGEPGLAGWTVELLDASNNVVGSVTTTTGAYAFDGVGPGSYTIEVLTQAGYTTTTPTSYAVTTTSGTNLNAENFGEFQNVTLAGQVFNDLNGNGELDPGEPGLGNWTVDLYESGYGLVGSDTTAADGSYSFAGVGPGTYSVEVVAQAGYAPSTATSYSVTTTSGLNVPGLNFGEFQTDTLGGEVFNDLNGNGVLDTGEPGLSGWTVDLFESGYGLVGSATTAADGSYSFAGVGPGTYTVEVVAQAGYIATTPTSIAVTTSSGQDVASLDFGEFQTDTLGGEVFNDLNGNGVLDTGEPGLSGWTVDLFENGYGLVGSTTTAADGSYSFAGVGPGTYTVEVVAQGGYQATTTTAFVLTTSSGDDVSGLDFGQFQQVTLAGEVFNDLNGNGTLDPGEPGLANWAVELLGATGNVVASTSSDVNGDYAFTGVGPGSYTIQVLPQAGYTPTTPTSIAVATASGVNLTGENFGEFQVPTVSGEVYDDLNGNGAPDSGEPGLANWTVELLNASGTIVATTTTDATGDYTLDVINPGTYTVEAVTPGGYITTEPATGTYTVTTSSGQSVANLDFGEFQTVTLGGEVFNDLNGNGALDTGEPGLGGWTVDLVNSANQTTSTTTLSADGTYAFTGVGPGSYTVEVVQQPGYTTTTAPSFAVTTTSGQDVSNLDFGEFANVALTGEVFNDLNGNGALNTGEPGLAGWTINLYESGYGLVATTTSGADGTYWFTGVGPGSYTVQITEQSGYVPTTGESLVLSTSSGLMVAGLNFGEFQTVTLSGEVFDDLNGNGVVDPGETGFSGWTVNLLDASDKVLQTTTTDANGDYSFSNVGPGAQTIQEVPQTGAGGVPYVPTVPSTGTIALTPTSGTNVAALNFGNILQPEVVDVRVDYGSRSMSILNLNRDLPFVDITGIEIIFNENVTVSQANLSLVTTMSSGNTYNFTGFSYNASTFDAKWTLPSAIGVDELMMSLDGSSPAGVHVPPSIYLGNFTEDFSVLPGDVNGDRVVNASDMYAVEEGILNPSTATVWEDVDGSGVVDFTDYTDVRKWLGKKLP